MPAGKAYRVIGAAWTGESIVNKVEFSADEGKSWANAALIGKAVPFAWQLWEYNWSAPTTPGRYKLLVRATDQLGNTQPVKHDPNRRNYMINFTAPMEIDVL